MPNRNSVYIIIPALIFISLSIGIFTYVLTNIDLKVNLETLSKKVGDIEITAVPKLTNAGYEFSITLNTHSTELTYDLVSASFLTNESGQMVKPSNWEGDEPGGHHRKGQLFFPLFPRKPKVLNLTISGVGGESVNFNWEF